MRISFRIHYHTKWGQQIILLGSTSGLGQGDIQQAPLLQHLGNGYWGLSIDIPLTVNHFKYRYLLIDNQGKVLDEDCGELRDFRLSGSKNQHIVLHDAWRSKYHEENVLYTSAFQEVIFKNEIFAGRKAVAGKKERPLHFQLYAPRVEAGRRICLLGSIKELGSWKINKAVLLSNEHSPLWTATIHREPGEMFEYKYGIYDVKSKKVLFLEQGGNRELDTRFLPQDYNQLFWTDGYFNHPSGRWKGAGLAIPVFSLRSAKGFGIGEFTDIKPLADWAEIIGLKMLQILPINDTIARKSWIDSYPYAAISVFALHPIYLNLEAMEGFTKAIDQKAYDKTRKKLNALAEVDYEAVLDEKLKLARQIYKAEKSAFLTGNDFINFMKENGHWLKPYAWFCLLRDRNGTADFNRWKTDRKFSNSRLQKITDPTSADFHDIAFYYFLQFHLDRQLRDAADYARNKGLVLKGDIPIGIYRHSVDAWVAPRLYKLDGQSGAPPDPFSDTGQNWGFPTYNWQEMARDGYRWWQQRLEHLSQYFDAFRIDHILGFFRIWEIPLEQVEGTLGHFNPAIPVQLHELREWGISFDRERFCEPWLPPPLLDTIFESDAAYVKKHFLTKRKDGNFSFKPALNTQHKIKVYFAQAAHAKLAHLKAPLFQLISNVLFLEVPGSDGQQFHPRIDFNKTTSFQALDEHSRRCLEKLYNNYFYERQEEFWEREALRKLPAIKAATNMMICGEDLGMVPACVPGVMKEMGFLSLELQRMSKNPQTEFLQAADIPYLSVCSPGTHDMAPIRLWWKESDWGQRQRFYNRELGFQGLPPDSCEPELVEAIIRLQLHWPGIWAVFPLQDLLALSGRLRREVPEAERINVPANPQHYWRFRIHIELEQLKQEADFNAALRAMLQEAGRL